MSEEPVAQRTRRVLGPTAAFWVVAGTFWTIMSFATVPTPLYVLYQAREGWSAATATVVFSAYAVGVLGGLVLLGHLSDSRGRLRLLLPAVALSAVSAVLFVAWPTLTGLNLARVLSGVAVGMTVSTGTAMLGELNTRAGGAARRATVVAVAVNIGGLAAGPLVAGVLADLTPAPLVLPYLIYLGLFVLVGIALLGVPETVEVPSIHPRYRPQRVTVPPDSRSRFAGAALAAFVAFALFGLFAALGPAFVLEVLGESSHTLGGLPTALTFGTAAMVQAVVRDPGGRRTALLGFAAMPVGLAVAVLGAWTAVLPLFLLGEVVVGAGAGVAFAAALATASRLAPPDRRAETLAGIFTAAYAGLSVPVVGLGVATSYVSLPVALSGYAVLATIGVVLAGRVVVGSARVG